jgi:hypothetical protein
VAAHTSYTPAPEFTATVAPFRAWRGLRLVVAREPVQAAINHKSVSTARKRLFHRCQKFRNRLLALA